MTHIDAAVAQDVAWIRGRTGIALADATHLACARPGGASTFVTNDRPMPALPKLSITILDDLVA